MIKIPEYDYLIQQGEFLLKKGNIIKAVESYRKAIDILDEIIAGNESVIGERDVKFRLLDELVFNESLSKLLILPLIKQKIYRLKETNVKVGIERNYCIYCGIKPNKLINFCSNCGRIFKPKEPAFLNELLLDEIGFNKSVTTFLDPSLVQQLTNRSKKTRVMEQVSCIYCGITFNFTFNFCTSCGKDLNSDKAFALKKFSDDVYERFLNYEFLINLFDEDLGNAKNLLIYEKKFENLASDFHFPKIYNWIIVKALIRILQVTRLIQQICHPELLTHYTINKIHDALYNTKDIMGRDLKYPWGFYKFEETEFSEEYPNIANGSRTDIIISYKDASANFDYEGFFFMLQMGENWTSKIDFDKPEISVLGYTSIIENKITAFATKLKDGVSIYKIYLLESKPIKLFNKNKKKT
ncbi:MAG: hypothetical protein ACTSQL_03900 [Promethearchaeota archaeon]